MQDLASAKQPPVFDQALENPRGSLIKGQSSDEGRFREESPGRIHRVVNFKPVSYPGLEVLNTVPGGRMDATGPGIESDVIGQHDGDLPFRVERMDRHQAFQVFSAA